MIAGFIEFEFDLPHALLQSLIAILDKMAAAPLTSLNVANIPEEQGVYQLLYGGRVVYVGKTDGEAGLRQRLARHSSTILHRQNLFPADVQFKAVRVFVFTAIDLETQLIKHYGQTAPLAWNNSGFGSNDPGRNRDTTALKDNHFDLLYPIDLDEAVDIDFPANAPASSVLSALRAQLPYTFRFEGDGSSRRPHPELVSAIVPVLPPIPRTTRQILKAVLSSLPAGWQATSLAGRIVMYRENQNYVAGSLIGRSGDSV